MKLSPGLLMILLYAPGFAIYIFWKVIGESNSYITIPSSIFLVLGMVQTIRWFKADQKKPSDVKA